MSREKLKIKRNDLCPCASGKKYKHCCEGKVDWNQIIRERLDWKPFLSIRGKNIIFLERIFEALQLDSPPRRRSLTEYKAAFTPHAVKTIHEAIVDIWPPDSDIEDLLRATKSETSGLYIGEYKKNLILRGITRHSLYANKILLVDPFVYPLSVREPYNAILHPEQFRTQTLRNVDLWFSLIPWISAGIVEFIRTPADFDKQLNWDSLHRQKRKFEENEELKTILEETTAAKVEEFTEEEGQRMFILNAPDGYLRHLFRKLGLGSTDMDEDAFIAHVHKLRKADPYYLGPLSETPNGYSEYHIMTTGASYDIARLTASLTDSYLVTDLPTKWKEIEIDRNNDGVDPGEWEPLAKAFQNVKLQYLDAASLDHALILRQEERLSRLRTFLRKTWAAACTGNPYGEHNVQLLTDALEGEVAAAEEEWKQIDRDLLKWFGGESAATLLAAGPLISSGHAGFLGAAFVTASTTTLISAALKRKGFKDKLPAAFFMDLKKEGSSHE